MHPVSIKSTTPDQPSTRLNSRRNSGIILLTLLPWCLALTSCGQPQPNSKQPTTSNQQPVVNARDLFYQQIAEPGSSPAATGPAAGNTAASVGYCIELLKPGSQPTRVTNAHSFVAGDGIRFHMKTGAPVYVYILAAGSSGKTNILFPKDSNQDNKLMPGNEFVIPPKGALVFDNQTGAEHLSVILSPQTIDFGKDASRRLSELGETVPIYSDLLTGNPEKVGSLSVVAAPKESDAHDDEGWVYVNNSAPDKPAAISISLYHGSAETTDADRNSRVQYSVMCLKGDIPCMCGDQEAYKSLEPKSNVNGGLRDQYIMSLNHLYVNSLTQRLYRLYYTQVPGTTNDSGERLREGGFNGPFSKSDGVAEQSPGPLTTIDGIAAVQEIITNGKCTLAVGETTTTRREDGSICPPRLSNYGNKKVTLVKTGQDLDAAWEAHGETPLILAIDCGPKMFGGHSGGHVVVARARRKNPSPSAGATSSNQFYVINSWGASSRGWADADHLAYAMNFDCQIPDPTTALTGAEKGLFIPPDAANVTARPNGGIVFGTTDKWTKALKLSDFAADRQVSDPDSPDSTQCSGDIQNESARLNKYVADSANALTPDEQSICKQAIDEIAKNSTDGGSPRAVPLSDKQKLFILQQANRLFVDEQRVFAQGLNKADRNRAVTAMLHDTANPEHMNQGDYSTCNVTTIAQIEELLRPAAQSRRFVDMYTNVNGDQTVSFP